MFALIIQSSNFVVTKPILNNLNPYAVACLRAIIPALLVPILFLIKKPMKVKDRKNKILLFVCALGNFIWFPLLSTYGLSITSAVNASIVFAFSPIITIILCSFFLKDKLDFRRIIGIMLSTVGVITIINPTLNSISDGSWIGDLLILIATVGSGISYVASAILVRSIGSYTIISFSVLIGGGVLAILFIYGQMWEYLLNSDIQVWIGIFYIGVFGVLISNGLMIYAVKYVSPVTISSTSFLVPFLAIILSVLFLKEHVSIMVLLSGLLILIGVYFTKYKKREGISKLLFKGGDSHESKTFNS